MRIPECQMVTLSNEAINQYLNNRINNLITADLRSKSYTHTQDFHDYEINKMNKEQKNKMYKHITDNYRYKIIADIYSDNYK